ncbi:MAG TPA: alpha/beta hydrolase [Amaricoccus sp.]|uniref:alpha/beta fold hydrolase n=1 Tax=Amaricoccus sp. TaxID=1872485 RepID=UPI002B7F8384|nr:alpha/beta hydrolase [Amaricoccus sp.]HMQ93555.1 alpha/beta hydrolase [Amaricoccus sp.]HMR54449.1 alpha/beta hydrolase [Amaricoccus sp.]HMR60963.1 alpha/beta hydrolase [Amaricoccus sp.]HMU01452.1 alpha/beta hydrolase [Amaricoccus sp.]
MKRFVTSDGLGLAYADEGSGLPLLCLAGLTRNGEDFDPVRDAFGADLRLIRLDSRGRGASDFDPDPANYNVAVEARDALELLDHLGLERVALLGTSRGGLLSMVMAAAARERLIGVMLNDIGPVIEAEGLARILTYLGVRPSAPSLDMLAAATAAQMRPQFPGVTAAMWRVFLGRTLRETPAGLELRYDPALRHAFLAQSDAGEQTDLWPLFDALAGVPLALLRGANSDILSQATAEAMRERRPDMALTIVPDRGHVPFLDEPCSQDAIGAFLARLAP